MSHFVADLIYIWFASTFRRAFSWLLVWSSFWDIIKLLLDFFGSWCVRFFNEIFNQVFNFFSGFFTNVVRSFEETREKGKQKKPSTSAITIVKAIPKSRFLNSHSWMSMSLNSNSPDASLDSSLPWNRFMSLLRSPIPVHDRPQCAQFKTAWIGFLFDFFAV